MSNLEIFMKQLSYEMELANPLQSQEGGRYILPIDEDTHITISKEEQGILFSSNFVECPNLKKESFLENLLVANLFGQGTSHAVLGLNETGEKISLTRFIDDSVSYRDFSEILEDFINTIDFWKQETLNFR